MKNDSALKKQNNREMYADYIRFFAIIFVLIIHTTANYYVESYGSKGFLPILIISSLTSSAVPLFYMLSGTFLINEKNTKIKYFYKKILKLFIQIIFWTLVYLLVCKYFLNWDINLYQSIIKSFTSEQVGHLWYIYSLLALYILTPFISKVYFNSDETEKKYLLLFLFIIPAILCTIQSKFWNLISIPKFAIIFPELGLFIFGKYLYDHKDTIQNKKYTFLSFVSIIIGILLIVFYAKYFISSQGISNSKPYFDANKIPNIVLVSSLYIFFLSINKKLYNTPNCIKNIISLVAKNTGGIYFIHMLYIYAFPCIKIFGISFTQNQGCLLNMLLGSMLYFIMSLVSVLIIKKIPVLNKTV